MVSMNIIRFFIQIHLQCGQSSPSQRWGADLRAHCSVKFPMTPKMGLERSQLFPEIFEIVLRPFWWAAGSEQPSPPLHRAAAARLLRCFDKYKSLYTRNMIANRRWSGGDGYSLPAAHQNDRSTISNFSGNSWDLSSLILRVIKNFTLQAGPDGYPRVLDYSIFKSLLVPYSKNFTTRLSSRVVIICTFLAKSSLVKLKLPKLWQIKTCQIKGTKNHAFTMFFCV